MAVLSASATPVVPIRAGRTRLQSIGAYCRRNPGLVVGLVMVGSLILTARVASGVMSRGPGPVPPVLSPSG